MASSTYDVVAVGNAIIDLIQAVPDSFLAEENIAKDAMTLPVLIYTHGIVTFDLPGAAVIATVQVALSIALYGGYRFLFARLMGGSRAAVDPTR